MTLAVVVGIGYLYATPYLALRELKAAFDRKAFRELGGAMDVASLKKSLKDSIANASSRRRASTAWKRCSDSA